MAECTQFSYIIWRTRFVVENIPLTFKFLWYFTSHYCLAWLLLWHFILPIYWAQVCISTILSIFYEGCIYSFSCILAVIVHEVLGKAVGLFSMDETGTDFVMVGDSSWPVVSVCRSKNKPYVSLVFSWGGSPGAVEVFPCKDLGSSFGHDKISWLL